MLLMKLLILLCCLEAIVAAIYTKQSIQEKQEKYEKYMECLRKKHESAFKFDNESIEQRHFEAMGFLRDANIKLKCFVCLAPDEEDDIEEIWKPNDSFIGRTIRMLKDKIKTALLSGRESAKEAPKTTFDWEFMAMKKESTWKSVINLREPPLASAKARKVVESFMKKSESKAEIGDHFELEIHRADHKKHAGFYRCVRRTKETIKIEQVYFIDVFTHLNVEARQTNNQKLGKIMEMKDDGVEAVWEEGGWGDCNKCGNETGEQHRRIQCIIQPTPQPIQQLSQSRFSFLTLFPSVPCFSSLVPADVRLKLQNYSVIEEFQSCQAICPFGKNETRFVKDFDDDGNEIIKDELPPNEFGLFERLPPLKSTISRKTIRVIEGDGLVLDCDYNSGGILWRKDFKELPASQLLAESKTRRYINVDGQFVITKLEMDDAGFYSCLSTQELRRTFHLYVSESNRTAEIVGYIQISIRYFTGLLIAVLITRVILKTNTNSERIQKPVATRKKTTEEQK